MTAQNRDTLKGYFTVGSVVDESDMVDFIDSMSHNNDEKSVSVFIDDPNTLSSAYFLLFQPERDVTITYYSAISNAATPGLTHRIVKMGGGSSTNITADSTTVHNTTGASSFPTITLASPSVTAGQYIAVVITGGSTSPNTTFTIRYK